MDLIYTNSSMVDQGVLLDYELDLAFGADENNLECRVQSINHCCEAGSFLYMEGTEYGGIVDSIESKTDSKEVIYRGRTWHGILNSKVLQPDSGQAYLVLNGEANAVIADLLSRLALTDLFEASSEDSGLKISNYRMNRYITGYDGIRKMLGTVDGKLKMTFNGGKVVLSAAKVHDYTQDEEFDADQVPFTARRNYRGVNHLICLGSGQLEERMVIHLYADTEGNISRTQTQFGLNEVCSIYEYSNIESEEELLQSGTEEFKGMMATDEISIDFDADSAAYDVGDIIGAVDNITGLSAYAVIAKKIVTVKNGQITVSLSPDSAKAGNSGEVGGAATGVDSFNGRNGAVVPESGDYTAAMVGAVPDGLIYQTFTVSTNDAITSALDTTMAAMTAGTARYIKITVSTSGLDLTSAAWVVLVYKNSDNYGFVDAQTYGTYSANRMTRTKSGGTWKDWCWDNPPMGTGVEYRTTERYNNLPVYVLFMDCGTMPNATIKTVAFPNGIVPTRIVRVAGRISSGWHFPVFSSDGAARADVTANLEGIKIKTDSSAWTSRTAYVQVWYTKD